MQRYPLKSHQRRASATHQPVAQSGIEARALTRRNSAIVPYASQSVAAAVPLQWLRSSRNLDFCLLAVCSCVLALLCHQTTVVNAGQSSLNSPSPINSFPLTRLSQIDLLIKSGLFTTSQASDEEEPSS